MDLVKLVDAGKGKRTRESPLVGYGLVVGGVVLATGVLWLAQVYVNLGSIYLVYLVVVVGVAARRGWGPGVLASVLSFLAANFFFIPPVFTFTIANPQDILALVIFLGLATGTSQVMARLRVEAQAAHHQARLIATLYTLSQTINQQQDLGRLCAVVAQQLGEALDLRGCRVIFYQERGQGQVEAHWPGNTQQGGRPQTAVPLQAGTQIVGRLILGPKQHGGTFTADERHLLATFAEQLGTAVQRAQLQEAATQAEVLRRTDALRAALLSAVSHDLRSPLGAIKVAATSLLSTRLTWSEADRRAFLDTIVAQVDHINRLVTNLLAMGRIEAGKLHPQKELSALGPIIQHVLERLDATLAEHPITVEVLPDLPLVPLDAVEIDEVLTNLLENTVKYTPPGTPVRVSAARSGEAIAVQVADQGPGISPDHVPYLFDRYYRVQGGGPGGTGLGLAIAKSIVEAHGGRLTVRSSPAGTTFTFTLPLTVADPGLTLAAQPAVSTAVSTMEV